VLKIKTFLKEYGIVSFYLFFTFAYLIKYISKYGEGDYSYSEYFINYSTGFTRRGLTGELILRSPDFIQHNIFLILTMLQVVTLFYNFFLLFKIGKILNLSRTRQFLLVFCPSFIGYSSWSYANAFKKDSFIIAFLLTFAFKYLVLESKSDPHITIRFCFSTLVFSIPLMLIHEAITLIIGPFIMVILVRAYKALKFSRVNLFREKFFFFVVFFWIGINMFFVYLILGGENYNAEINFKAVDAFGPLNFGPFKSLHDPSYYGKPISYNLSNQTILFTYLFCLIFTHLILCTILNSTAYLKYFFYNVHLIIFALVIFSDWDRLIQFWTLSLFCYYCLNQRQTAKERKLTNKIISKIPFLENPQIPGFILFLVFRVPVTPTPLYFSDSFALLIFIKFFFDLDDRFLN
jgi:hypothetical protein